jgi:hypothetical protein
MEIDNTKLMNFLKAINNNLLQLIMQFITLSEAVVARLFIEAQYSPEILRQLNNSVRSQLMQLHPKLE